MITGRPTKYDPAYCEQVIDFMSQGYSVTAFAGSIGVARDTVYHWAKENPEFSDALNTARAASAVWWEERLRAVAERGEGNATAAIFGLKNRVAHEWRERQEVQHGATDAFAQAIAQLSRRGSAVPVATQRDDDD